MHILRFYSVLILISFLIPLNSYGQILDAAELTALLNHPARPAQDKSRDKNRKPAKLMKFAEVGKDKVILDIYAGGGWYSELFSLAVGNLGKVYAHNDHLTWRFGKQEMQERTKNNRLSNLVRIEPLEIEDIALPDASVDIAFMAINYHDLYFISRIRNNAKETMRSGFVDYKKALSNIKRMLKKEGILVLTDHSALPGSGYQAANDLHRIDPNIVKYELAAAGFILTEQAFYLQNPNDDLTKSVFTPELRGRTDRFIFKFTLADAH